MVADPGRAEEQRKGARSRTAAGPKASAKRPGVLRLPDLDRLIHERIRLGIVSALAAGSPLSFAELKRLLRTSDGNLSVHTRKLEDAGYLACEKRFEGRVPRTEFRLTRAGRDALERYLSHLDALVRWAKERP
jgi:DNA-binding transcriptional ArsR family regulator